MNEFGMVFEPEKDKAYVFCEFLGPDEEKAKELLGIPKRVIYFEAGDTKKENAFEGAYKSLKAYLEAKKPIFEFGKGGIRLNLVCAVGSGRRLSGWKTLAEVLYEYEGQEFLIKHTLGYEFPEWKAIETYEDPKSGGSPEIMKRCLEDYTGLKFENPENINYLGIRFSYEKGEFLNG